MNVDSNHWICVFVYVRPGVGRIDVWDSMRSGDAAGSDKVVHIRRTWRKWVQKRVPGWGGEQGEGYNDSSQQMNCSDCAFFAVSTLWCLCRDLDPDHQQRDMPEVRESFAQVYPLNAFFNAFFEQFRLRPGCPPVVRSISAY